VRQNTEGIVGGFIWYLLEIYLAFQQWKNFENPLRIDKVVAMSLVYYFLGAQCSFVFRTQLNSAAINSVQLRLHNFCATIKA